jgi:hypothetical protein
MMYLLFIYSAGRNDFDEKNINYEGQMKGWALKSRLFWAPIDLTYCSKCQFMFEFHGHLFHNL